MGTKAKTFDCVAFKRRAQERLMAEYEERKDEFSSEIEFLNAKADESEIAKAVRAKIGRPEKPPRARPA
jgi:hypothetical protein